jgi:hypothetical protein
LNDGAPLIGIGRLLDFDAPFFVPVGFDTRDRLFSLL